MHPVFISIFFALFGGVVCIVLGKGLNANNTH